MYKEGRNHLLTGLGKSLVRWVSLDAVAPSGSGVLLHIGNVILEIHRGLARRAWRVWSPG